MEEPNLEGSVGGNAEKLEDELITEELAFVKRERVSDEPERPGIPYEEYDVVALEREYKRLKGLANFGVHRLKKVERLQLLKHQELKDNTRGPIAMG